MKAVTITRCPKCDTGETIMGEQVHTTDCVEMPPYESVQFVSLPDLLELIEGERLAAAKFDPPQATTINKIIRRIRKETQSND